MEATGSVLLIRTVALAMNVSVIVANKKVEVIGSVLLNRTAALAMSV